MTGFIYALGVGNHVKIGYSNDPERRRFQLQSHFGFPVSLLGVISGTLAEEQRFHRTYKALAIASETYPSDAAPIVDFLSRAHPFEAPAKRHPAPRACEPAATIIRLFGGDTALSRILGIHRTRVANWKLPRSDVRNGGSNGKIPQAYWAAIVKEAQSRGLSEVTPELLLFG